METQPGGAGELERWWRDHSELDRLVACLVDTIDTGSAAAAESALEELASALEGHLSVEEDVYFPLVEKLSSDHREALRDALRAHDRVRSDLDGLRSRLREGELTGARRELIALLNRFRLHEEAEARLITELAGS